MNYFIVFVFLCINFSVATFATEFGSLKYNDVYVDYSKFDKNEVRVFAENEFVKAIKNENKAAKKLLFQSSLNHYYILTQIDSGDIHSIVQMARIYDFFGKNSYAKAYFFRALKIDINSIEANYYFGDFYYSRNDYKRALYYYEKSYNNGEVNNYELLVKIAKIYEALGDLLRANQFYKRAYLLNPKDVEIPDKIEEIEAIKYQDTGYYSKRHK